jgi:hypothetical protein
MLHKFQRMSLSICLNLNLAFRKGMTIDEKVRYGMLALGGASVILTAMGLHIAPLNALGGSGEM